LERLKAFIENEKLRLEERIDALNKNAAFIHALFEEANAKESSIAIESINWQLIAKVNQVREATE
jgi:hypothetical protein